MNAAAANALLKTLEEPPPGTYPVARVAPAGRAWPRRFAVAVRSSQRRSPALRKVPRGSPRKGSRDAGRRAGAGRRRTACSALRWPIPAIRQSARRGSGRSQRLATLSVSALGQRIDAGPRESRKERLAAAIDWLVGWCADLARVPRGRRAVRKPGLRRGNRRRSRRRWRGCRCFAIIAACWTNARCLRTRCSRASSRRRC